MKNKIIVLFFIFFIIGCKTGERIYKIQSKMNYPEIPSLPVIENFENSIDLWRLVIGKDSYGRLEKEFISNNNVGVLFYSVPFSDEEFSPYFVGILYEKSFDLSKFKGLKFYASSDNQDITVKLKIFEIEYFANEPKKEIWYKKIKLSNQWQLYRIDFNTLSVEEFYEQDYVSDNIQNFQNVSGIAIFVQNNKKSESISGKLYIDNIEVY